MANLANSGVKINTTKSPKVEEMLVPIELLKEQIFSTANNIITIIGGVKSDSYIEDLFSDLVPDCKTPFSDWLIANRQLIVDSNRARFGYLLLHSGNTIISKEQLYQIPPKAIVKAIIRIQTYITYAKNPSLGFKNAFTLPSQCYNIIMEARKGNISNCELFDYLQSLKGEAKQYEDFWNIDPDIETLNRLSEEMMEAAQQSIIQ